MSERIAVVQVDPVAAADLAYAVEMPAAVHRPVLPSGCASGGCGSHAEVAARPAPPLFGDVRVNGVEITPEAIAEEIQHHPAASEAAAWTAAARALAVRELLLQAALARELAVETEEFEPGRRETDEDALIGALLDDVLEPMTATPAECRRYYDNNRERFRTPELFEASHILIEPEGNNAEAVAVARMRAQAIATEVGDDPAAFAAAAREFSRCPTAHQNGSLGQVRRGELVDVVQQALEALPAGTTGRTPVRSSHGWHVLRLERRIAGHTLPFDMVSEKIADMLEARAWSVAAARYVAGLAATAEVEGVVIDTTGASADGGSACGGDDANAG